MSPDALTHFSARLAIDPSFRRDVTAIAQAVIRREKEAVDYMDLLAILVVAAIGEGPPAPGESQEESVREILRFLTHIRRSAPLEDAAAIKTVLVPLPHVEPLVAPASMAVEAREPVLSRASFEADVRPFSPPPRLAEEEGSEALWWRGRAAWIVGISALLVGLGSGWVLHHERSPERYAAESSTSGTEASLNENKETATLPRIAGRVAKPEVSAARKPSAADARYANDRADAAVAPLAEPIAPGRVSHSSDRAPNAAPELSVRTPAPAPVANASPRSTPSAVSSEIAANNSMPIDAASVPSSGTRRRLYKVPILKPAEPRRLTSTSGNPAAPGVVHPGSAGMMAANLISSPAPAYPPEAFQARVQGEVTVRAVVDREGNITDARVVSGPELLRGAALEAVQHWRYRPYMQGGKPMEVATTAIVDFELP